MIATIPDDLAGFVAKSVSNGRYANADEAVAAGLRLLQQTDQDHLRMLLTEAEDAIVRGDSTTIRSDSELHAFFDEIIAEGEQERAAHSPGAVRHAT